MTYQTKPKSLTPFTDLVNAYFGPICPGCQQERLTLECETDVGICVDCQAKAARVERPEPADSLEVDVYVTPDGIKKFNALINRKRSA